MGLGLRSCFYVTPRPSQLLSPLVNWFAATNPVNTFLKNPSALIPDASDSLSPLEPTPPKPYRFPKKPAKKKPSKPKSQDQNPNSALIFKSPACKLGSDYDLSSVHQTLNLMVSDGFPLDKVSTDIAVRSLCSVGRVGEAMELIKELSLKHSMPDSFTYNFLIRQLCKTRALSIVYNFIDELKKFFNITPDLVTYTILIDNVCNSKNLREATREGDTLKALGLLEEMEPQGCAPISCTYNTLPHGLCKSRLLDKGIKLYEVLKNEHMKRETASYVTFLRALCREDKIVEAYEVFDYAVESKSLTDVAAYATVDSTLKWLKKAKEKGQID
ncbi:Pentatricopeptide repeat [Dillenia turbinata]|uniref:Pentatricopeptide repeat n=1 Tax=Dillenia turbinata TaxID=194707 RepID=A0AAN8Z6R9_9MAGN